MTRLASRVFAAALILLLAAAAYAAPRSITEKDFLRFQWVADPEISPDGRDVAYVLVSVNEKEDRYTRASGPLRPPRTRRRGG